VAFFLLGGAKKLVADLLFDSPGGGAKKLKASRWQVSLSTKQYSDKMTIITTIPTYIGAGIILTRIDANETRYLLLKGRDTGVWSFSKGHPESCDRTAPLRTAVRETFEETGLVAGRDYAIMGDSIRFGKRPYWVGVMNAAEAEIMVCRVEHTAAAWFSWEEICELKANTDVRAWIKKSRGLNGQFRRLTSAMQEMQGRHLTV